MQSTQSKGLSALFEKTLIFMYFHIYFRYLGNSLFAFWYKNQGSKAKLALGKKKLSLIRKSKDLRGLFLCLRFRWSESRLYSCSLVNFIISPLTIMAGIPDRVV